MALILKNGGVVGEWLTRTVQLRYCHFPVHEIFCIFPDDATVHEFKLYAVNLEGFGEPAVVQFTTPKRGNLR